VTPTGDEPVDRRQSLTPAMAEAAALTGAIERWAGDLALGEEPARFLRALEEGAP
jgi:hypothetical protein